MKILPTLAEVREIASDVNYNVLPVSCEILSDFTTPIEIIPESMAVTESDCRSSKQSWSPSIRNTGSETLTMVWNSGLSWTGNQLYMKNKMR